MITDKVIRNTAEGFSKVFSSLNLYSKFEPINKHIDDLLIRFEEFEAMFTFIQPTLKDSLDIIKLIHNYKPEFDQLCERIGNLEFMISHIRSNLELLEIKIKQQEVKLDIVDAQCKITNFFSPLSVSDKSHS